MRISEEQYIAILDRRNPPAVKAPRIGVKGIIRQSRREPNKTEKRFEIDFLAGWQAIGHIHRYAYEPVTLAIANGCRYTPDWRVVRGAKDRPRVEFYEIKARKMIWDDAVVKLKVAASLYPEYDFYLCAYDAKTGWIIERVRA
jgi:hypothetical protein